jgi:hypothetical protein
MRADREAQGGNHQRREHGLVLEGPAIVLNAAVGQHGQGQNPGRAIEAARRPHSRLLDFAPDEMLGQPLLKGVKLRGNRRGLVPHRCIYSSAH